MGENEKQTSETGYKKGFFDGIPICLGYIPISLAFGISASNLGLNTWVAQLMSATIYSATGQLSVLNSIEGGEISILNFAILLFIINCRYLLISISMAQRLDPNMGVFKRILFGFFNSDEIFAIAVQNPGKLKAPYLFGLITLPFAGWMFGSIAGCLFTNLLPKSIADALGIILYAMIIALVIPAAKKSKHILFVVITAILMSMILECIPAIKANISSEWIIIICAIVSATFGAIRFPIQDSEKNSKEEETI